MLKFKRLNANAKLPTKAHPTDAGWDLTAYKVTQDHQTDYIEYDTQITVAIPAGHVGLIFPRSSISSATDMMLNNSVGVIDESYRGPLKLRFRLINGRREYAEGDRVGQLVVVPLYQGEAREVENLDDTDRGEGGFGSSGA